MTVIRHGGRLRVHDPGRAPCGDCPGTDHRDGFPPGQGPPGQGASCQAVDFNVVTAAPPGGGPGGNGSRQNIVDVLATGRTVIYRPPAPFVTINRVAWLDLPSYATVAEAIVDNTTGGGDGALLVDESAGTLFVFRVRRVAGTMEFRLMRVPMVLGEWVFAGATDVLLDTAPAVGAFMAIAGLHRLTDGTLMATWVNNVSATYALSSDDGLTWGANVFLPPTDLTIFRTIRLDTNLVAGILAGAPASGPLRATVYNPATGLWSAYQNLGTYPVPEFRFTWNWAIKPASDRLGLMWQPTTFPTPPYQFREFQIAASGWTEVESPQSLPGTPSIASECALSFLPVSRRWVCMTSPIVGIQSLLHRRAEASGSAWAIQAPTVVSSEAGHIMPAVAHCERHVTIYYGRTSPGGCSVARISVDTP